MGRSGGSGDKVAAQAAEDAFMAAKAVEQEAQAVSKETTSAEETKSEETKESQEEAKEENE